MDMNKGFWLLAVGAVMAGCQTTDGPLIEFKGFEESSACVQGFRAIYDHKDSPGMAFVEARKLGLSDEQINLGLNEARRNSDDIYMSVFEHACETNTFDF